MSFRNCNECGGKYSPNIQEGGKMPRGYKKCPYCNSEETKEVKKE